MKRLKYIKLFEAFESTKLSKTLGYVNAKSKQEILKRLKLICKNIDFPISKLDDSYFQYLPFHKALNLKYTPKTIVCQATSKSQFGESGIEGEVCQSGKIKRLWGSRTRIVDCTNCNGSGIQPEQPQIKAIKFWFTKEGELVIMTGIDNISKPKIKANPKFNKNLSDYKVVGDRVPENRSSTNSLEKGDIILVKIRNLDDVVISYVWKEGRQTYFLQEEFDGDTPSDRSWRDLSRMSWNVTNGDYIWFQRLELKNKVKAEDEIDPFSFNRGVEFDYRGGVGIDRYQSSSQLEKLVNKAHFALVFDLDKLNTSTFRTIRDIKSEREEVKSGSVLTQKNEDIKKANIERYMREISKRSDIVEDVSKLSKVIKRMSGNENILILLLNNSRFTMHFNRLATLYLDALSEPKDEIYYKSNLSNFISERYQATATYSSNISRNLQFLSKYCSKNGLEKELKIVEGLKSLSNKIFQKISQMPFECIEDIDIVKAKLDAIRLVFRENRYELNLLEYLIDSLTNESSDRPLKYLIEHHQIQNQKDKIIRGIGQATIFLDRF